MENKPAESSSANGMMGMMGLVVVVVAILLVAVVAFVLLGGSNNYDGVEIPDDYLTYNQNGIMLGYPEEGWEVSDDFGVSLTPTDTSAVSLVTFDLSTELGADAGFTAADLYDMDCGSLEEQYDESELEYDTITGVELNNSKGCVIVTTIEDGDLTGTGISYLVTNEAQDQFANLNGLYVDDEDFEDDVRTILQTFEFSDSDASDDMNDADSDSDEEATVEDEDMDSEEN